jgi:hypothetical protein
MDSRPENLDGDTGARRERLTDTVQIISIEGQPFYSLRSPDHDYSAITHN